MKPCIVCQRHVRCRKVLGDLNRRGVRVCKECRDQLGIQDILNARLLSYQTKVELLKNYSEVDKDGEDISCKYKA